MLTGVFLLAFEGFLFFRCLCFGVEVTGGTSSDRLDPLRRSRKSQVEKDGARRSWRRDLIHSRERVCVPC